MAVPRIKRENDQKKEKEMMMELGERRGVIQERREKVKTPNLEFSQF